MLLGDPEYSYIKRACYHGGASIGCGCCSAHLRGDVQTSIHTRTSEASIHFMMAHHGKGGRVGACDGQRGTQSWGCYGQRQEKDVGM